MTPDILALADKLWRGEARSSAGHLAEFAWQAAPDDPEVRAARHRVFTIRAERATSTMSSGVYRWAASESFNDSLPPSDLESS